MDKLTIISGCLFLAADIFAIASIANPDWINTGESAGERRARARGRGAGGGEGPGRGDLGWAGGSGTGKQGKGRQSPDERGRGNKLHSGLLKKSPSWKREEAIWRKRRPRRRNSKACGEAGAGARLPVGAEGPAEPGPTRPEEAGRGEGGRGRAGRRPGVGVVAWGTPPVPPSPGPLGGVGDVRGFRFPR